MRCNRGPSFSCCRYTLRALGNTAAVPPCAGPHQRGVEGDFQFSSLKRKWLEEEGKFLSGELRRAQDLCVQQEMELESLRQQNAALNRLLSQVLGPEPSACLSPAVEV